MFFLKHGVYTLQAFSRDSARLLLMLLAYLHHAVSVDSITVCSSIVSCILSLSVLTLPCCHAARAISWMPSLDVAGSTRVTHRPSVGERRLFIVDLIVTLQW